MNKITSCITSAELIRRAKYFRICGSSSPNSTSPKNLQFYKGVWEFLHGHQRFCLCWQERRTLDMETDRLEQWCHGNILQGKTQLNVLHLIQIYKKALLILNLL